MLTKEQLAAYTNFYDSARYNNTLTSKTSLMIHMAAAMAVGCYP